MTFESTKSVLVTGASSGIGNATAFYLAKQSYTVLAAVRKDSDAKVLMVKKPKTRYQIGHMSKLGAFLENLPQSWVDSIMERREKK